MCVKIEQTKDKLSQVQPIMGQESAKKYIIESLVFFEQGWPITQGQLVFQRFRLGLHQAVISFNQNLPLPLLLVGLLFGPHAKILLLLRAQLLSLFFGDHSVELKVGICVVQTVVDKDLLVLGNKGSSGHDIAVLGQGHPAFRVLAVVKQLKFGHKRSNQRLSVVAINKVSLPRLHNCYEPDYVLETDPLDDCPLSLPEGTFIGPQCSATWPVASAFALRSFFRLPWSRSFPRFSLEKTGDLGEGCKVLIPPGLNSGGQLMVGEAGELVLGPANKVVIGVGQLGEVVAEEGGGCFAFFVVLAVCQKVCEFDYFVFGPVHEDFQEGVLGQQGVSDEARFVDLDQHSACRNVLHCENAPPHLLCLPEFQIRALHLLLLFSITTIVSLSENRYLTSLMSQNFPSCPQHQRNSSKALQNCFLSGQTANAKTAAVGNFKTVFCIIKNIDA